MNNFDYPLRVSKNKPPSVFSKRQVTEQKINEENIENNLVFCIDPRKTFAIKSIQRSVFSKSVTCMSSKSREKSVPDAVLEPTTPGTLDGRSTH